MPRVIRSMWDIFKAPSEFERLIQQINEGAAKTVESLKVSGVILDKVKNPGKKFCQNLCPLRSKNSTCSSR